LHSLGRHLPWYRLLIHKGSGIGMCFSWIQIEEQNKLDSISGVKNTFSPKRIKRAKSCNIAYSRIG
jgi:hypothetical protein